MTQRLVFDVGFNVGQDTGFYLSQGHRVVAIEADPTLAAAGRERFAEHIARGDLEILNVGVSDSEGEAQFWICDDKPEFNSFFRGIAARDGYRHHSITVPTTRFATVLERFGTPYYLKVDVEGHDLMVLSDLSPSSLPRYVSVESECPVDDRPAGVEDGLRTLRTLYELGYRKFKLIDQRTFCSLDVPPSLNARLDDFSRRWLLRTLAEVPGSYRLSRRLMPRADLQRRFGWAFQMGSSGAWGEDTAGSWTSVERAERAYRHYRTEYFKNPDVSHHSFWCDWHASTL